MSKVQELEKQIQKLQVEIEKLKLAEQGSQWIPKNREMYWVINDCGQVPHDYWNNEAHENYRLSIGNVFRTEREAKFEIEKRRVITELKKYAKEFVQGEDNYYIYIDLACQKIFYSSHCNIKHPMLYFSSKEIAMQVVEAVGKERIMKYYFGVG